VRRARLSRIGFGGVGIARLGRLVLRGGGAASATAADSGTVRRNGIPTSCTVNAAIETAFASCVWNQFSCGSSGSIVCAESPQSAPSSVLNAKARSEGSVRREKIETAVVSRKATAWRAREVREEKTEVGEKGWSQKWERCRTWSSVEILKSARRLGRE
jgi:hypothetical protein